MFCKGGSLENYSWLIFFSAMGVLEGRWVSPTIEIVQQVPNLWVGQGVTLNSQEFVKDSKSFFPKMYEVVN